MSASDTGHITGHRVSVTRGHETCTAEFAAATLASVTSGDAKSLTIFLGSRTAQGGAPMASRRPSEPAKGTKPASSQSASKSAKSSTTSTPTIPASAPLATSAPRPKSAATQAEPAQTAKPASAPTPTPTQRASKTKSAAGAVTRGEVSADRRRAMIAEAAYLRAERRGFAPGHEVDDWFAAEREVDALLSAGTNASKAQ